MTEAQARIKFGGKHELPKNTSVEYCRYACDARILEVKYRKRERIYWYFEVGDGTHDAICTACPSSVGATIIAAIARDHRYERFESDSDPDLDEINAMSGPELDAELAKNGMTPEKWERFNRQLDERMAYARVIGAANNVLAVESKKWPNYVRSEFAYLRKAISELEAGDPAEEVK